MNQSPYIKQKSSQKISSDVSPSEKATDPVMHSFTPANRGISGRTVLFVLVLMVFFGVGTGYSASLIFAQTDNKVLPIALNPDAPQQGKSYGSGDPEIFKDVAEGVLKQGGINGEGQYHLERSGGDSQNVYMTSSTLDLGQFLNRKIKVWGETQEAQSAGWLMDVGKVEVLE